jgi:predicted nucleic acid-binding protein
MKKKVLLDTGPLVAVIDRRDRNHQWATREWENIEEPLLTCEPVITEACFLVRNVYGAKASIISLINKGVIEIAFNLNEEAEIIEQLINRYQSVPMSLADACLVRMAELFNNSSLLTLDSDFRIYRKNRNEPLDLIIAEHF